MKYDGGHSLNKEISSVGFNAANVYKDKIKLLLANKEDLDKKIQEKNRKARAITEQKLASYNVYERLGNIVSDEEIELLSMREAKLIVWKGYKRYSFNDYINALISTVETQLHRENLLSEEWEEKNEIITDAFYERKMVDNRTATLTYLLVNNKIVIVVDKLLALDRIVSDTHLKIHIASVIKDSFNETLKKCWEAITYVSTKKRKKNTYTNLHNFVKQAYDD